MYLRIGGGRERRDGSAARNNCCSGGGPTSGYSSTPAPGSSAPSSGLCEHCSHMHILPHRHKHTPNKKRSLRMRCQNEPESFACGNGGPSLVLYEVKCNVLGDGETRRPTSIYYNILESKRPGWGHCRRWRDDTTMAVPSDRVMVASGCNKAQYTESTG